MINIVMLKTGTGEQAGRDEATHAKFGPLGTHGGIVVSGWHAVHLNTGWTAVAIGFHPGAEEALSHDPDVVVWPSFLDPDARLADRHHAGKVHADAKIASGDSAYLAHKKLHAHVGSPAFNPRVF
jgi:hypothetical protein